MRGTPITTTLNEPEYKFVIALSKALGLSQSKTLAIIVQEHLAQITNKTKKGK